MTDKKQMMRSEEEKAKICNVALATPEQAFKWVKENVRLTATEYYAIRDVETRKAYWFSVKEASCEEGDTGAFWREYLENCDINM